MDKTSKYVWMNGKIVTYDKAVVPVMSHTLHYGFGCFEGIRAYEGNDESYIFRLQDHVDRLFASVKILGITIPYSKEEVIEAILETIKKNKLKSCYIRPLVYLGDSPLGLSINGNTVKLAITCWPMGAYLGEGSIEKGIRVKTSSYNRPHVNSSMTKAKISGQYVTSILAKQEALIDGYDEALMLDNNGYIVEASAANIFMVKNGMIYTPPYSSSILGGITRESVINISKYSGHPVIERNITRDELYTADEVFLCGTACEVTPVVEIDNRVIDNGQPGEITKKITERFMGIVRNERLEFKEWLYPYSLKD